MREAAHLEPAHLAHTQWAGGGCLLASRSSPGLGSLVLLPCLAAAALACSSCWRLACCMIGSHERLYVCCCCCCRCCLLRLLRLLHLLCLLLAALLLVQQALESRFQLRRAGRAPAAGPRRQHFGACTHCMQRFAAAHPHLGAKTAQAGRSSSCHRSAPELLHQHHILLVVGIRQQQRLQAGTLGKRVS